MSLSREPTWRLVQNANLINNNYPEIIELIDKELDLRKPDEATFYFGDCAGKQVFIPIEPEYDNDGMPIASEMIGYDDKGNEVFV